MLSRQQGGRLFSLEQGAVAILLLVGLYFPTSTNGEHSLLCILAAFAILLCLLALLAWKFGTLPGTVVSTSLPIVIVVVGCTFCSVFHGSLEFDWGLFTKFAALALLLALDLRRIKMGGLARAAFVLANLLNIGGGLAILIGNQWLTEFLPRYYWSFYPELMPAMMELHKPVLTLGTHASAGLLLYLFFWVNWEAYKERGSRLSLLFALGHFVLLLGLTSFTSVGFAALALGQMCAWLWKHDRRLFTVGALSLVAMILFAGHLIADQIDNLRELPQLAEGVFLNSDLSGPLGRFGQGGSLREAASYVYHHPLLPLGLATPPFFLGDSGPVEYVVRGSIPLLLLIYIGLYRFLHLNLASRAHSLLLFLVIVAFEVGFSMLTYVRTLYLLPFFIVYLNQIGVTGTARAPGEQVANPVRQVVLPA